MPSLSDVNWDLYSYWMDYNRANKKNGTINSVLKNYEESLRGSPIFQPGATLNGVEFPLGMTRKNATSSKISLLPGDILYAGDIVQCYGERWLVMEVSIDEYGFVTAIAWLCNHTFRFQNHTSQIIEKYGIIDDGSYSSRDKKELSLTISKYAAYMPLDLQSRKIYVDKRFAIGIIADSNGSDILEVYKTIWMDIKSKNFGAGSHLLQMQLEKDVYNKESDDITSLICDYIAPTGSEQQNTEESEYSCTISGKTSMRIGTRRQYIANVTDSNGDTPDELTYTWNVSRLPAAISTQISSNVCQVSIPLDANLVGNSFDLSVSITGVECSTPTLTVEVVNIG